MQAVLYFVCSEIGSQWSCCRRGVHFWWHGALRMRCAAVFWTFCIGWITELGLQEENCNSLIWTIHKKLPDVLLHLLWGTYWLSWCILVHSRLFDRFWLRVASRINSKFLTLSENTISCVLTMIDNGKQWQEDREGVEKRMASVLSSFSLSWLLHIHAFMSFVHDWRSFGGVDFWSCASSAKSWWLTEWFAVMSESGVVYKTNSTGPNIEPCGTPNMRGDEEEAELLTTTHWFLSRRYDQKHWRAVERMPKAVLRHERKIWQSIVSNAAQRSSKSKTEILSLSVTFNKSFTMHRSVVSVLCLVR